MRSVIGLLLTLFASVATAQQLPAPHFRSPPANDNSARAATTSFVQDVLTSLKSSSSIWTGSNSFEGALSINRRIANTGTLAPANSGIFSEITMTGGSSGVNVPYNAIISHDMGTQSNTSGAIQSLLVEHNIESGAQKGSRTALTAILHTRAATDANINQNDLRFYTGVFGQTYIHANDGGTPGNNRGNYYGVSGLVETRCYAPAPFCYINGLSNEFDMSLTENSSANYLFGVASILVNGHSQRALGDEAFFVMNRDGGTLRGLSKGISIGTYFGYFPLAPDATVFGVGNSVMTGTGSYSTKTVQNGIDFSPLTITDRLIAGPRQNFYVTGAGLLYFTDAPGTSKFCVYANQDGQLLRRPKISGQACNHDS